MVVIPVLGMWPTPTQLQIIINSSSFTAVTVRPCYSLTSLSVSEGRIFLILFLDSLSFQISLLVPPNRSGQTGSPLLLVILFFLSSPSFSPTGMCFPVSDS